jgi:hypothetical protein
MKIFPLIKCFKKLSLMKRCVKELKKFQKAPREMNSWLFKDIGIHPLGNYALLIINLLQVRISKLEQGNTSQQNQDQATPHKNDTQNGQPKGDMGTIAIVAISKTPLASIPGSSSDEIIPFDPLQPVVEEIPSLGEYFFSPEKKAIIKGRPRKRKMEQIGDIPPKQTMIWDASKLMI